MEQATLIFFCGKMGAGKTTQSRDIAQKRKAVLLSEDEWLESLYPNKITSLQDYIEYSRRLKPPIKKLVQSILASGTHVVMDFPANTVSQRQWFKSIFTGTDVSHELVYIDLPNEDCLKQIEKRRIEQPQRAKTDTREMFEQVTQHFVAPQADEGFNITRISKNQPQLAAVL